MARVTERLAVLGFAAGFAVGFAAAGGATGCAVSPAGATVAAGGAAVSASATSPASDFPLHAVSERAASANAHVRATMCTARDAGGRVLMFSSQGDGRCRRLPNHPA